MPASRCLPGPLNARDARGNRVGGFTSLHLTDFCTLDGCSAVAGAMLTHDSGLLKTLGQAFFWRASLKHGDHPFNRRCSNAGWNWRGVVIA